MRLSLLIGSALLLIGCGHVNVGTIEGSSSNGRPNGPAATYADRPGQPSDQTPWPGSPQPAGGRLEREREAEPQPQWR